MAGFLPETADLRVGNEASRVETGDSQVGIGFFLAETERTGGRGGEGGGFGAVGEEGEGVFEASVSLNGEVAVIRGERRCFLCPPSSLTLTHSPHHCLPFSSLSPLPSRSKQFSEGSGEERRWWCPQLGQEGRRVRGLKILVYSVG